MDNKPRMNQNDIDFYMFFIKESIEGYGLKNICSIDYDKEKEMYAITYNIPAVHRNYVEELHEVTDAIEVKNSEVKFYVCDYVPGNILVSLIAMAHNVPINHLTNIELLRN